MGCDGGGGASDDIDGGGSKHGDCWLGCRQRLKKRARRNRTAAWTELM